MSTKTQREKIFNKVKILKEYNASRAYATASIFADYISDTTRQDVIDALGKYYG